MKATKFEDQASTDYITLISQIMNRIAIFSLIAFAVLTSCTKETIDPDAKSLSIVGKWENPIYKNDTIIFSKVEAKEATGYYINIKSDGSVIERKNAGWCGTPPIAYSNYNGTWEMKDSVMQISVEYWGGMAEYKWKLLSVDNEKLRILRLQEEYK